tara:strand:+ start:93 stop:575 length:483 start_codon:yes stop_codon:yes gene_type:complete
MQVIDNFLDKKQFDLIHDEITGWKFPWYYQEGKVSKDDGLPSLTHCFFHFSVIESNWFDMLRPIIDKNNMMALRRVKANFDYANLKPRRLSLHTDAPDGLESMKTGILYINTNNGKTYFEDGTEIDSVANRMVIFDSKMKHGTITQTDTQTRIIINFNWY